MTSDERIEIAERMRGEGLYDRMVEHLRSACATCVYGFFEVIGYSCGITRKPTSDVVVKCEAYKRRSRVRVVSDDD